MAPDLVETLEDPEPQAVTPIASPIPAMIVRRMSVRRSPGRPGSDEQAEGTPEADAPNAISDEP